MTNFETGFKNYEQSAYIPEGESNKVGEKVGKPQVADEANIHEKKDIPDMEKKAVQYGEQDYKSSSQRAQSVESEAQGHPDWKAGIENPESASKLSTELEAGMNTLA